MGSSGYAKTEDTSWGLAVLMAIETDSVEALRVALQLPGADVDGLVENDSYITRGRGSPSRHDVKREDWERNTYGQCELFSSSVEGAYGIRGLDTTITI